MRLNYSGPTQEANAHQEMPAMFVDYEFYLTIGTLAEIRERFAKIPRKES